MKYAIIVDGFSSGKLLFEELKKKNIPYIHVLTEEAQIHYGANLQYDDQSIIFNGNYNELILNLEKYDISYVFIGCETGVEVAEKLSALLGLPGNNSDTTERRRNKQIMQEAISDAGLEPIQQIAIKNIDECKLAVNLLGKFPVILKSLDDGASINTFCCHTLEQLTVRAKQLLSSKTSMGKPINTLLIQEMLLGQEYIINSISYNGEHFITDMWCYSKKYISGGGVIPTRVRLLNWIDFPDIVDYVKKILDALDIKFGAAHTEVIQNCGKINLVETGARLMGGEITYEIWQRLLTYNQIDGYLACQLHPELLPQMSFKLKEYACIVIIPIYENGKVSRAKSLSLLVEKLSSVIFFEQFVHTGDIVTISKDDTGPYYGYLFLAHKSRAVIEHDLEIIKVEEEGLLAFDP